MDYRKIYENYFKIKIPKGYDIHHIDFNRKNNDLNNLVMLPSSLHKRYHFYLNIIKKLEVPQKIFGTYDYGYYLDEKTYKKFLEVHKECSYWFDYRENLRYVNNIKLKKGE